MKNENKGLLQFPHPFFSERPSWKWFILLNVLIGATMSALDVSIVNVAMPTLKTQFNTSMAVIEWVAMSYMITLTVLLPFFGRLADIFGRSKLYNIGFIIFTVGSWFCGMANSAGVIIAARVLQAIGAGLLQANSVALITQAFPGNERGKAIGIQGAVQAIAMAVGPFVGGVLISAVGWRLVFYINIPIGIVGTLAAMFILPTQEKSTVKQKIDYVGTFFFATGLAFLVLLFNEGVKLGWESPTILTYGVLSLVLLALFVVTELRVENPLLDINMFKNMTFLIGNITGMMSYYVLFTVLFLMPFYCERVLNYSPALTGSLLTPIPLAMAIIAPFSGWVSDKYRAGTRLMTSGGMMLCGVACFALLFVGAHASVLLLVAELVLLGFGMGMFTPPNNSAIMGAAPRDKLGLAGGILNMMRSLGLIFGVDISGVVFTTLEHKYLSTHGYSHVAHVFQNGRIPLAMKDHAFMRGFIIVIGVLLVMNISASLLSVFKQSTELDAETLAAAKEAELAA
ncbi:MAG: MFS transporter [Syntrophobacteraceae bacterium]|nr:MFS transporter [Syntrophobacteraceae bacterium]